MVQYHIVEIQQRADGINNIQPTETRNSLATGLSYFYDRCSKMVATELYPYVTIIIFDSDGTIIDKRHFSTAYQGE